MAVDVVAINYHTPDLVQQFKESFMQHAFDGCKLTIVDVESGEDSEYITDNCGIDVFKTRENIGYARACNIGALYGINDVILLANSDTILTDSFKQCHDVVMENKDWGVLGPRQIDEYGNITAGGIVGPDVSPRQRGWNEFDRGQYSDVLTDVPFVSGSLLFVKRSVWNILTECSVYQTFTPGTTGPMLPTPHYFEDTTLGYHARAHGYKCVYYGPAQMVHLWHRSSNHGGWADQQVEVSKMLYRSFCQLHGIAHE